MQHTSAASPYVAPYRSVAYAGPYEPMKLSTVVKPQHATTVSQSWPLTTKQRSASPSDASSSGWLAAERSSWAGRKPHVAGDERSKKTTATRESASSPEAMIGA